MEAGTTVILTTPLPGRSRKPVSQHRDHRPGKDCREHQFKKLLASSTLETFVLDLRQPISQAPVLEGAEIVLPIRPRWRRACPNRGSLNRLFRVLEEQGIEVTSMRKQGQSTGRIVRAPGQYGRGAGGMSVKVSDTQLLDRLSDHPDQGSDPDPENLGADPDPAGDHDEPVFR